MRLAQDSTNIQDFQTEKERESSDVSIAFHCKGKNSKSSTPWETPSDISLKKVKMILLPQNREQQLQKKRDKGILKMKKREY